MAYREEYLERPAAQERQGGDPLEALSSLSCCRRAVEGWGHPGAGLRLRDGGEGGGPRGDRRTKGARGADRPPPLARGSRRWRRRGGAALLRRHHLLLLAREDPAGGLHRGGAGAAAGVAPQGI